MKKLWIAGLLLVLSLHVSAQTGYETAMNTKITQVESHLSPDQFSALSNDFKRIGEKEKTQWLPYYYAAFSQIQKGRLLMRENKLNDLDAIAGEAQKSLDQATALSKDNAEILILQKMIHSLKMMVDPMYRYMTEGMAANQALEKAQALDPTNPRITLLKAEDTYFTPAQFGGSKEKGIELFKKSIEQFGSYKPASAQAPNWGKAEAEYFLSQKP